MRLGEGTRVSDLVCVLATLYPGIPGILDEGSPEDAGEGAVLLERDGRQVDLRDEMHDNDVIRVTAGPAFKD